MGCVESGVPVQIVRLTYSEGLATSRSLPADQLQQLMKDPLLRSTSVLSSVFHEGAVVGEADSDRAFYQEINYRLGAKGEQHVKRSSFLNAQNKHTICRIIGALRRLGIPAAAIVDLDVIKEGGKNWSAWLDAAQLPSSMHPVLEAWRVALLTAFTRQPHCSDKECVKKHGGLTLLSKEDAATGRTLFDTLGQYGVFVVPLGEVESWLKNLNVSGHGSQWLIKIFEEMKSSSDDVGYIQPGSGDVWDFMKKVAQWIHNPTRLGVS